MILYCRHSSTELKINGMVAIRGCNTKVQTEVAWTCRMKGVGGREV